MISLLYELEVKIKLNNSILSHKFNNFAKIKFVWDRKKIKKKQGKKSLLDISTIFLSYHSQVLSWVVLLLF